MRVRCGAQVQRCRGVLAAALSKDEAGLADYLRTAFEPAKADFESQEVPPLPPPCTQCMAHETPLPPSPPRHTACHTRCGVRALRGTRRVRHTARHTARRTAHGTS